MANLPLPFRPDLILPVLVVDDVMTTGATLDELAHTLKTRGAAGAETLVLTRVLKD